MAKRILVLSAAVGAGHMRAAQAVEQALKEISPESDVRNVDVLTLTNAAFRRLYGKTYLDLAHGAPHVVAHFYEALDRPRDTPLARTADRLRLMLEQLNLKRFHALFREPWDLVIHTHYLPAELLSAQRRAGKINVPQFIVTTDFMTHRMWVHSPCEHYFTATVEGARYLASCGVDTKIITASGIPIHPIFSRPRDGAACRAEHKLPADRPVVLQLAGGFGVGPIAEIYQGILAVKRPIAVVAVTGRNEKAREQLAAIPVPDRHVARVMGFTDRMDELMAAASLVVSKPGGLTVSESLARGAPLAIVNPIPGQESQNSDFLLEHGAAVKIHHLALITGKLEDLLAQPERLDAMRRNAFALGRPRAALDIARFALEN